MLQLVLSILAISLAVGYGIFLLVRLPRRFSAFALLGGLLACVVLEGCDLQGLRHPESLAAWKRAALVAESCLPFFWLLFSLTFSREGDWRELSPLSALLLLAALGFPVAAFGLSMPAVFYSPDFADEKMLFLGSGGYFFYVALMAFLVMAIFHLEQTLMALPRPDRWRVKFELIGTGVLLAVLVIYYSQALLYRSLDMNLMPVRSLCLILGVGMMAYSRIRRGEADRIRVSREMAYRSMVVLAVGCYLIGLGLFGAGMRYFDFVGNRAFYITLCVLLGLAIVAALLSEKIRRRFRVALHKHFYQRKYDYRQEWQQFTTKLSAAKTRDELERGILAFFTETFSLRGAALYLRDQDSDLYRSSTCLVMDVASQTLSGSHPVVETMCQRDWVISLDEEIGDDPEGELAHLKRRGYSFLVPMRFERGLEGFVVLGRRIYEEERLTYEDFDLMKILAHQAIGVLLSRKLYSQLVAANEMAAIGRVSTFVIHDLKNLVSGLGMVVDNARDYIEEPEFRADMFETLENTVDNMKGLIARLQNVKQKPLLELVECDLLEVARAGVALSGGNGIIISGSSVPVSADPVELQKVFLNLVHNAREASGGNASVLIDVGRSDLAYVRVSDQGCGMTDDFIRTRLFKPFETTKKKGMGIGLYQCRQVVEALGGRIEVKSVVGEGSLFTVWLPLPDEMTGVCE